MKTRLLTLLCVITPLSLLIELVVSPMRGYVSVQACAVVAFALYFIFINIMLRKYASRLKPQWILLACLVGCSLIQVPIRVISFSSSLISLPDFLFHLFGIFAGYFFYTSKKYVKSAIVITSLLCCVFLYFKGYDLWLHKLSFGTFTGVIQGEEKPEFQFTDSEGNAITNQNFAGKYVVLDFWNTACGVCFQKFPVLEEQYAKYSSNATSVAIYAVNLKLSRDREGAAFEAISKRGYSFPVLQADDEVGNIFGVVAVPTVIVLNPAGTIIFRGSVEKAFSLVEKELQKLN